MIKKKKKKAILELKPVITEKCPTELNSRWEKAEKEPVNLKAEQKSSIKRTRGKGVLKRAEPGAGRTAFDVQTHVLAPAAKESKNEAERNSARNNSQWLPKSDENIIFHI